MRKELPDQSFLLSLLSYDPSTGVLTWKRRDEDFAKFAGWSGSTLTIWNTKFAGKTAKRSLRNGYIGITILGQRYFAHRIIWKMVTGLDPDHIDHFNGQTSDNRFENLSDVSALENQRNRKLNSNNRTGQCGVHWCRTNKKWTARIRVSGESRMLGRFSDFSEAVHARKRAERETGFSPNHGRI